MTLTKEEVMRWAPEHGHGDGLRTEVLALIAERDQLRDFSNRECAARQEAQVEVARLRAERDDARAVADANAVAAVRATQLALEATRLAEAAAEARAPLLKALNAVSANCDHADGCDRAQEHATHDTPCSCCMREVEAAIALAEGAKP